MSEETRNFGGKFGSQGITALYPYSRYNGASTNKVDLYIVFVHPFVRLLLSITSVEFTSKCSVKFLLVKTVHV